ncbi:cobalt ECF transporter T component CbiQ [Thermostilla marina]
MGGRHLHLPVSAERNRFGMDARLKIVIVVLLLVAALNASNPLFAGVVWGLAVGGLRAVGIPAARITRRFIALSVAVGVVAALQIFMVGKSPLWQFGAGDWRICVFREGTAAAVRTAARVFCGTSLLMLLVASTPMPALLKALHWFRVPETWLELVWLTYRAVVTLGEDGVRVFEAQRLRLGYASVRTGTRSLARLAGVILVRAFSRSADMYDAMVVRGYTGEFRCEPPEKIEISQWARFCAVVSIAAILFIACEVW